MSSTELKAAKDALVASLFELSKSAQEASTAVVNFFNIVNIEQLNPQVALQFQNLSTSINNVLGKNDAGFANGGAILSEPLDITLPTEESELSEEPDKKKRKKGKRQPVDPNAPKKPVTMFFAFAAEARRQIKEERERLKLLPLSNAEMTQEVAKKWNELSEEAKAPLKRNYDEQFLLYRKNKEEYLKKISEDETPSDLSAARAQSSSLTQAAAAQVVAAAMGSSSFEQPTSEPVEPAGQETLTIPKLKFSEGEEKTDTPKKKSKDKKKEKKIKKKTAEK